VLLRRFVLLLTVALAGAGVGDAGSRHAPESRSVPELVAADHDASSALIRSNGHLFSASWQVDPVRGPWPRGGRTNAVDGPTAQFISAFAITAVVARVALIAHRGYARPIARAHSGFLSSPSTAPPRFRFV